MFNEAKLVLDKIAALDKAADGDSNDAEIDAALDLREAGLELVRKVAEHDISLAQMLDEFDRQSKHLN